MRKKVIKVWVLVVIMMLSMAGCGLAPNTSMGTTLVDGKVKLEFEVKGTYVLEAFGEEYYMYRFDEPNEKIVVYKTIDGIYLVGEYGGRKGVSYGNIFMPNGEFLALSNEYLLFENEEGKVAISLEKRKNVKIGESFYKQISFEKLTEEEKNAFVFPVEVQERQK